MVRAEEDHVWNQTQERKRWFQRKSVRILIALVCVTAAAAVIPHELHVTAECVIVARERVFVRASISGVLAEITVDEGSRVKKGDIIARLDDRALSASRRKTAAELARIEAALQRLHAAAPGELGQQRAAVQTLHDQQVAALEAERDHARAELESIDHQLAESIVIRAPIDGVVLTPKLRERLHAGVKPGDVVCEIANTSTVRAEIFAPEREVDTIAPGMPVVVKVESYPLRAFHGTVDFIAPAVEKHNDTSVVRVVVSLDNPDGLLRQNMNGYGEIACGERSLLDLMTRRIVRWVRVRFLI